MSVYGTVLSRWVVALVCGVMIGVAPMEGRWIPPTADDRVEFIYVRRTIAKAFVPLAGRIGRSEGGGIRYFDPFPVVNVPRAARRLWTWISTCFSAGLSLLLAVPLPVAFRVLSPVGRFALAHRIVG